jgi:hypothetical protein
LAKAEWARSIAPAIQWLPFAVASWYAVLSLISPLILASMAAWSLYVILTSRLGTALRPPAEPLV